MKSKICQRIQKVNSDVVGYVLGGEILVYKNFKLLYS